MDQPPYDLPDRSDMRTPGTRGPMLAAPSSRLVALDAVRGMTIAGMILVNNPGSWRYRYPPLRHAEWNGWTPTDLVFPFFLFIVGVSIALAFGRRIEQGARERDLLGQVVCRSLILFLLGLTMYGFPNWRLIAPFVLAIGGLSVVSRRRTTRAAGSRWLPRVIGAGLLVVAVVCFVLDYDYFHESRLRVPGVLQRIGACYLVASVVALTFQAWGRSAIALLLMLGYWWIVSGIAPPADYVARVTDPQGLLHDWIDVQLLGEHLYRSRPDPEGLLSTMPAIATTLLGLLAGAWLRSDRDPRDRTIGLFMFACVLVLTGWAWDWVLPINKKIWTPSYACLTAGLAMHLLAMCYWWIDVRQFRRWATPFCIFGTNAIVVFFASSLLAKMMSRWKVTAADGSTQSLKAWIYEHGFAAWAGPLNGSLAYALAYVLVWLVLIIPLYRHRIYIKI